MQFQRRDAQILTAIYDYGGVLARTHLKEIFWEGKSWRAMEVRLAKLRAAGYLTWADRKNQHNLSLPVVWLAVKGISYVALTRGVDIDLPTRLNESALRKADKKLRKEGINWTREPSWSKLGHDLDLIDIRRSIEKASILLGDIRLGEWISEYAFRSEPDRISYQITKGGRAKTFRREVIPDGYFMLINLPRQLEGKPHQARFLLELDMGTHSNPNFGRFKAAPYAAYLGSDVFLKRFGGRFARLLIVTTGRTRVRNLMMQCQKQAGGKTNLFYFAEIRDVLTKNPITDPIWRVAGQTQKKSLVVENP